MALTLTDVAPEVDRYYGMTFTALATRRTWKSVVIDHFAPTTVVTVKTRPVAVVTTTRAATAVRSAIEEYFAK